MTLRDEIKKQAEELLSNFKAWSRENAIKDIEQALLERHNKGVEMAAQEAEISHDGTFERKRPAHSIATAIRALKEKP